MDSLFLQMEKEIMEKLLAGKDEILEILREQYAKAEVESREFTGVGFFTVFKVKDDCKKVGNRNFEITDGEGCINDDKISIGFVLFIKGGRLDTLEGFTYGSDWPDKIHNYKLSYTNNERDYEALRKKWK